MKNIVISAIKRSQPAGKTLRGSQALELPVPELCPADQAAAAQEANLLLGENHREEHSEQPVLLPGERPQGGIA